MSVKELYDRINEALVEGEHLNEARLIIGQVAEEVGVDLFDNDDPWSHDNMLRVVRAVQCMALDLQRHRGLTGRFH